MDFTGNMVALVTPFRNGSLDQPAFAALIERVIAHGASGVIPCGTTGESPTLSHEEHDEVVALAVETVNHRVTVVAGAGSNATTEAIRLTKAAATAGADAVLSVSPYYNRPTQKGLTAHFHAVADATDLPVVVYDIPSRCGVRIAKPTFVGLAEHKNIQAVKIATGDVEDVTFLTRETDLTALSGDDCLTLPMLALGARGVISVISNLLPGRMTRMVQAALSFDFATARREHDILHPLMRTLFVESNPAPVKAAMARIGWIADELRLPLSSLRGDSQAQLERDLAPFLDELNSE